MDHRNISDSHTNIAVVGPANSGKTTLVRRIIGQDPTMTTPTIGFDVKTFSYRGIKIFVTDLGGQKPFVINFWEKMLSTADGVIFVIDAAAPDKFILAYDLFLYVLKKMNNVPMIVLANKQDLPDAASVEALEQIFNFEKARMRFGITSLKIFPVSALRGDGVTEALDHLWSQIVLRTAGALPLIHNIFVYQRTTGRPLALAQLVQQGDDQNSSIQMNDPSLISAFYAVLTVFSKEFVTSPVVQSLRLRNPIPTSPDYFLFNYSDTNSNLSCLIVTSGESNEVLEEFIAERIITFLKMKFPWMMDEDDNNKNYVDINSLAAEVIEQLRMSSGSYTSAIRAMDIKSVSEDLLWTKVLLSDERVQDAIQEKEKDDTNLQKTIRAMTTSISESDPKKIDVITSKYENPATSSSSKESTIIINPSSNPIIPTLPSDKNISIRKKTDDRNQDDTPSWLIQKKTEEKKTEVDKKDVRRTGRNDERSKAITLTTKESAKVSTNEKINVSSDDQERVLDDDDDDEYYKKFRQLSIMERVRELEKRRQKRK